MNKMLFLYIYGGGFFITLTYFISEYKYEKLIGKWDRLSYSDQEGQIIAIPFISLAWPIFLVIYSLFRIGAGVVKLLGLPGEILGQRKVRLDKLAKERKEILDIPIEKLLEG